MPIRYYPLSAFVPDRYTRGNEFILEDGTPFRGRYYTTYNGNSYAGSNPLVGDNRLLIPIGQTQANSGHSLASSRNTPRKLTAKASNTAVLESIFLQEDIDADALLQELKPYFPAPLEEDYQRGYFTRYFAKTVSGPGYIFEISKLDWTKIQNGEVEDNVLGYETADMLWQLTGPLNDRRISQYQIQGGIFDTNKRVTEGEERTFRGIVAYIGGDYTKFARITP